MNGSESIKKAAINKAKQVAHSVQGNGSGNGTPASTGDGNGGSAGGSGSKKRRKQDLKPIITTEQQQGANPHR